MGFAALIPAKAPHVMQVMGQEQELHMRRGNGLPCVQVCEELPELLIDSKPRPAALYVPAFVRLCNLQDTALRQRHLKAKACQHHQPRLDAWQAGRPLPVKPIAAIGVEVLPEPAHLLCPALLIGRGKAKGHPEEADTCIGAGRTIGDKRHLGTIRCRRKRHEFEPVIDSADRTDQIMADA